MIAKIPTIAAMAYKYHIGSPSFIRNSLSYAANFLRMCFRCRAKICGEAQFWRAPWIGSSPCTPTMSRMPRLQRSRLVQAHPEPIHLPVLQQASPVFGAPLMAANEAALKMLEEIGVGPRFPEFITKVKDKTCRSG